LVETRHLVGQFKTPEDLKAALEGFIASNSKPSVEAMGDDALPVVRAPGWADVHGDYSESGW
jgi:hypothetical protein